MSYQSSFAKPLAGSEFRERAEDAAGEDYYRFSGDDWAAANHRRRPVLAANQSDLEIVDSKKDNYEFAEDDLRHAKSTAARLTALEKIAASGVDKFKFEDKDGVEREFRVETNKCGDKTLIHCYGRDAQGHEQIVMRVARNASGELEPERNKDGKPVSYYGDNWSRTMQGKSVLIGENRNEHCRDDERASKPAKPAKHDEKNDSSRQRRERDNREDGNCDRESNRKRGRDQVRDRDDRDFDRDGRRGPRLDIGRALADGVAMAAPFLMAHLNNRNNCNDYYSYRDYPRYLPERGCHNYYDDYRRQREPGCRNYYDDYNRHSRNWQNHSSNQPIFLNIRNNNSGWNQHNRSGHGHNNHSNYRNHHNRRDCP